MTQALRLQLVFARAAREADENNDPTGTLYELLRADFANEYEYLFLESVLQQIQSRNGFSIKDSKKVFDVQPDFGLTEAASDFTLYFRGTPVLVGTAG